jgi:hypothetical protein
MLRAWRNSWRVYAADQVRGRVCRRDIMAAATAELIRILRKERAWLRLEVAVERVERAERLEREFTQRLDRWRAEPVN